VLFFILSKQKNLFKHGFETRIKLVKSDAALPTINAEIARGFSCMKRIKTDFRNKLSVERLQDLLMISLNGEEISDCRCQIQGKTIEKQLMVYEA